MSTSLWQRKLRGYHHYDLWLKRWRLANWILGTEVIWDNLCELLCGFVLIVTWIIWSFPLSLHSGLSQAHAVSVRFLPGQDLFVLGQHIVEDVEEDVNVVLLENQRWTETDRMLATPSQEDTFVSGLVQDAVACCIITDINGTEGPLSSSSAQYAGVLSL